MPEDVGKLSIEYRDGQPVTVVSGGNTVPSGIRVVCESGSDVALNEAAPATPARMSNAPWLNLLVLRENELPEDPASEV
ncbi:hypothetical protein [Streptomyces sp. NBC_01565]|uniref:hypothetical protein n=1 Tax=Streptomyces sp. NBC_01565 TaxID=2975881 RepID=UPI002253EF04|nr:hypothetical protein [Streptomyces sp. NBC_01565]MCX4546390.1 hypothetical protein [Streptomyces sp. NBC_01565]